MQGKEKIQRYKKLAPSVYDFVYENHLDWPCTTCQWGPVISQNEDVIRQKIFFASKTDGQYNEQENTWKKLPSTLISATIDIPKEGKMFNQGLRDIFLQEKLKKHNNLKVKQIIIHPGDANVMKKCPLNQKIVATKNDSNLVFLWDLDKHKAFSSFRENCFANQPDITLIGHNSEVPSFALDWAKTSYRIASGGKDLKILIWDLDDYQGKMQAGYMYHSKRELNSIGNNENLRVAYSYELKGHEQMIEDLSFNPNDKDIICSVSDDKNIIFWDLRVSTTKNYDIPGLHSDDINCVDWNTLNQNYIATGSSDGTANIIDLRTRKSLYRIKTRNHQNNSILAIKFSPFSENYLSLGADELYFYNIGKILNGEENSENLEPIFTHCGCMGYVNDFDWNTEQHWSVLCTCQESDEVNSIGGGQLQFFRPLDIALMDEEEAIDRLEQVILEQENQKDIKLQMEQENAGVYNLGTEFDDSDSSSDSISEQQKGSQEQQMQEEKQENEGEQQQNQQKEAEIEEDLSQKQEQKDEEGEEENRQDQIEQIAQQDSSDKIEQLQQAKQQSEYGQKEEEKEIQEESEK